jgi:hypothetical protein
MEPTNTRVRLLELVNAVRRLPNSGASEHVRRATVALAEAMRVDGITVAAVRSEDIAESTNSPGSRSSHPSSLPEALTLRIERTIVRWKDQDHQLRVTNVVPYPPPPLNRIALDVTVRTLDPSHRIEVTCRVRLNQLRTAEDTADRIAGAVRSALEGQVAPPAIVVL